MVDAPFIPAESVEVERRPGVGYAMVATAAVLFAVNGTVSKIILSSGISSAGSARSAPMSRISSGRRSPR